MEEAEVGPSLGNEASLSKADEENSGNKQLRGVTGAVIGWGKLKDQQTMSTALLHSFSLETLKLCYDRF